MKGIIFVEFLEMVEKKFGLETEDRIIEMSALPSGGAYTSVGTYDHAELLKLAACLSDLTGRPTDELVAAFGRHLFGKLVELHGQMLENIPDVFTFLGQVESAIHVEVKKLYPDAELPRFSYQFPDSHHMEITYQSPRPFASLALGLMQGAIDFFDEPVRIQSVRPDEGNGNNARFVLTRG